MPDRPLRGLVKVVGRTVKTSRAADPAQFCPGTVPASWQYSDRGCLRYRRRFSERMKYVPGPPAEVRADDHP
jgi:hypothetical protein